MHICYFTNSHPKRALSSSVFIFNYVTLMYQFSLASDIRIFRKNLSEKLKPLIESTVNISGIWIMNPSNCLMAATIQSSDGGSSVDEQSRRYLTGYTLQTVHVTHDLATSAVSETSLHADPVTSQVTSV